MPWKSAKTAFPNSEPFLHKSKTHLVQNQHNEAANNVKAMYSVTNDLLGRSASPSLPDCRDDARLAEECHQILCRRTYCRVPVRVSHVVIGESSKELAKPNLWILAILAKSIIAQIRKCFKIIVNLKYSLLLESSVSGNAASERYYTVFQQGCHLKFAGQCLRCSSKNVLR